ncbi:MAG TPA: helix-turn-helix domain-containing protein [Spirochaetota bacterium]|nr:helix-turn-helix domain-containing protein [Spirochaetota bacterium]
MKKKPLRTITADNFTLRISPVRKTHLIVIYGIDKGKSFLLKQQETTVGRDHEADITINDPLISRCHLKITAAPAMNKVNIRDLNSTNGTYINGNKIKTKALDENSYLQIGSTVLKIQCLNELETDNNNRDHENRKILKIENKIASVTAYIKNNLNCKFILADLAGMCGMEASYFSFFFKKYTGDSPFEFINIQRITKAAALLRNTSKKIIEIALETGFNNLSLFNRSFKKIQGMTPGQYRKKNSC